MTGLGLAALLAAGGPARADDTELYLSQTADDPSAARANILFIIDTSGSMDTQVETQAEWNPAVQFTGCYRTDALYFGTGTEPPPCGSDDYVLKSINRCAASTATLRSRGQYTDEALAWNDADDRWQTLGEPGTPQYLECQADRGLDGGGSSSQPYAANGAGGPWAADPGQEPAWNTQYTLFDGNWLNWRTNPPTVMRSRLQIVKNVVTTLLDDLQGVNIGLMQFNAEEGGPVTQAVTDIATSRQAMKDAVARLTPSGFTPLSETLYEAALYFRGGNVDFGNVGPVRSVAASRLNGSATATAYRSPIDDDCQKNFIILLTDGEPARDENGAARIRNLPGFPTLIGNCDGSGEGACLDDLAEYLNRADASATLAGDQTVVTYTIGFEVAFSLLEATARRGGGRYYLADDTGSLAAVLTELLAGIEDRAGTFVAPSIPVNAFNRAATERDVFVSLFQPSGTAHWPGNLKKYRLAGSELLDQDGRAAIDPLTGFFQPDVTSFWSTAPDGNRVTEGGAAGRLPASAGRTMYTDVNGGTLTAANNRLETANADVTAALLGVPDDQRDDLIRWIRGNDLADLDGDGDRAEARQQMGDPLHVRPVTLSYGATADNPDTVVFTATNDGVLHAVDADTGIEAWSYLPARLLGMQNELFLNPLSPNKRYGLDGEIRLFLRNLDGEPGVSADDDAILLFGMGRGGRAVFALDVSDRNAPRLLWQRDSTSVGLGDIGQIWAAPVVSRVNVGGNPTDVVILSGGYDDAQDNRGYREDSIGNAMYFLDLRTGAVIWSAGAPDRGHDLELAQMTHSIPAAPRVIDLTGDGFADRLYVGDTGGRLWRFDILNRNEPASLVTGGVLASLGAADLTDPPASEVRRFYATPDIVFVNCRRATFLAINIGSGYRGHPLDSDVLDQFFSVRDPNVYGALATGSYGTPIAVGDLEDITDDVDAALADDAAGWRLRLVQEPGEKVLNASITFDNSVFFTSFAPGSRVNSCAGGIGVNRAYQVDACNGRPLTNLDGSTDTETLTVEDRFRTLNQAGIAPEVMFLFPSSLTEGPTRCIGLVCFPPDEGARNAVRRTYWSPGPTR